MNADRARDKAIKELERTRPKWRQGEVTSTSPLLVSVGGGSPVSAKLVAGVALTMGDQVQVLQRGSDLLVLGVPSGTVSSGFQPLDSDLTAIAALTTTSFGRSLLELANAGAGRSALGLVIGTDVQAYDSDLAAIAALSTTSFGRSLLTQADAAAARSTIGAAASSHSHAQSDVTNLVSDLAAKAPLASPTFTGDPKAPTPSTSDNDTSVATTAFVKAQKVTDLTAPTSAFSMNSNRITNMSNATSAQDAVTLSQMQTADLAVQSGYTRMADVDVVPRYCTIGSNFGDFNIMSIATRSGNTITGTGNGKLKLRDHYWALPELSTPTAAEEVSVGTTFVAWDAVAEFSTPSSSASFGIYEVTQTGSAGAPFQAVRRSDADTTGELVQFSLVRGKSNGMMVYLSTSGTITINTTAQTWLPYQFYPSPHAASHSISGPDPLPVEPWINVSGGVGFTNSWVNFGSGFNDAGYYKDPLGCVHLRGLIKSGTLDLAAFALPSGYRPANIQIHGTASNAAFGYIDILTNGQVRPRTPCNNAWVSLDGISFRAA